MKLNFEQIKSITTGAVSVEYIDGSYRFNRFNKQELEYYSKTSFEKKSLATAGVEMNFETDATSIKLSGITHEGSSRSFYSFDVFKDGELLGVIKNFNQEEMIPNYVEKVFERGEFSGSFELGGGSKKIRIVFPWSAAAYIYDVELVGANYVNPIKKSKKMIIYGDSITQGYDAEMPSRSYASMLAYELDAEAYNKAIGGERFMPILSSIKNDIEPDYITVAYGTNDWFKSISREDFETRAKEFYLNLSNNYPNAKIFAISPIWRADSSSRVSNVGEFVHIENTIKNIADSLDNIVFISGFDFVPHDIQFYSDLRLHPRNIGFEHYAKNLISKIKEYI